MLHGQANSKSKPMTKKIGQEKLKSGLINLVTDMPLENQMTISLSKYIRENVETTVMNKLSASMGAAFPMLLSPISRMTSAGSALPLDANPKIRISMIVMTIVNRMTVEPPKFFNSSDWILL